jgi:hypothetical protein
VIALAVAPGLLLERDGVAVHGWTGEAAVLGAAGATTFALVEQPTEVVIDGDAYPLRGGCYAVSPGSVGVRGGQGLAIVVPGYRGLRQIGGPLEATGRLRYIDGCTDTLLVAPPRRGDPCLSHLHIPAGTRRTLHRHVLDYHWTCHTHGKARGYF